MSMFNDISWGSKENEQECELCVKLVSIRAKRFSQEDVHSSDQKKWYSTYIERPQEEWYRVAEFMMINFREIGHQVFLVTSPLSRGTLKSKGGGKLSMHFCADGDTIETVFRKIISVKSVQYPRRSLRFV